MPAYFIVKSWYSMTLASPELYSPIMGEYHDAIPVAPLRDFIDQCCPPTWNHGIMWTKILRVNVFWTEMGSATDPSSVGEAVPPPHAIATAADRAPRLERSRWCFTMVFLESKDGSDVPRRSGNDPPPPALWVDFFNGAIRGRLCTGSALRGLVPAPLGEKNPNIKRSGT